MSNDKTTAVRKEEALPLDTLSPFMHTHGLIKDVNSEIKTRRFAGGFSNLTYLLQVENKEYVLRRPPFGAPKRGHDMSREYKVLSKLYKEFTKIPEVYVFTDDEAVIGAQFYIMEKVNGILLDMDVANEKNLQPHDYKTIANTWLDTFVELHNVDYKACGLEDLGKPEGYVERQVFNWSQQYEKAKTHDIPESEKVMKWLAENQPREYSHSLIHNDFKYNNMLFKDDSWKEISTVLDWEMCTLGDPLMDLGTSLSYWLTESDLDAFKVQLPSPTVFAGNPNRLEVVEMYSQKSGRPINNLVFYYVNGLFKLAVIVQQIYYRFHKGHTSDPRFAQLDKQTQLMFTMAWQAIQKNKIDNLF